MSNYLLSGLKVVDAATVIAGPAAAMMLADFGADVIKIERPGRGDMLRWLSEMKRESDRDKGYMWQMDGRNKRSIAVDLQVPEGLQVLHRLAAECDVFITNMPYDSREKFRLTYEDLKPNNPRMIYFSLTAYGEHGEERARKGFDQLAYWARSGLMDLMRESDTVPAQGLPGMGDHPTAVSIYAGIVTALLQRERTGEGAFVQTSLLANGLWSNAAIAQGVMAGGDTSGFRNARAAPGYTFRVYRTRDDRWLQLNMVRNEELLSLLFTAIGKAEILTEKRFSTPAKMYRNRGALGDIIEAELRTKTAAEWMRIFDEFGVPVNLLGIVEEAPTDPQVLDNQIAVAPDSDEIEIPLMLRHPVKVSSVANVQMKRAPSLGEHSREILTELGYTNEEIDALISRAVIEVP